MKSEKYNLLLGSHIGLSAPDYFLGSAKEAVSYGENAFMVYTGAPQNTIRKSTESFKIPEAHAFLKEHNIDLKNVIVHAPYIINLCSEKPETRQLARDFLVKEIKRCEDLGIKYVVLHPGSRLKQTVETGLEQVIDGLNFVFNEHPTDIVICIETMAGKGSEVGRNLEELQAMIQGVTSKKNIGVCLDTCHANDGGYEMGDIDEYLEQFNQLIGLDYLKVVHLNDSKNPLNSHKDRHENIGYGTIGFEKLLKVVYHPLLNGIVKVLETPYVVIDEDKKKTVPPYKEEIEILRNKEWYDFKQELINKYKNN